MAHSHNHNHNHNHDHHHHHHHGDGKNVAIAFFLNLAFTIIEIIGGVLTNSVAIQSDALHDMGDTISLGFAWYFQRLSKKGRDDKFNFGYKRFNTLGAMITGVVLAAGSVYILMKSIPRLFYPEEMNVEGMIWLAILGVIINGMAVFQLKKGGDSLNERMMTLHLLEDVLGWVAVLTGSVVMYFYDMPWIDPVLSIGITLFVLYNVVKNLWKAGKIILQATPDSIDLQRVKQQIETVETVHKAHHLHLWTMDGEYNLLSAHIQTDGSRTVADLQGLKKSICEKLKEDFHIDHVTFEFRTKEDKEGLECVE